MMTEEENVIETTYPIEKQDYTIDTEDNTITITITNTNYKIPNTNKNIINTPNMIKLRNKKWETITLMGLNTITLPTTTTNITTDNQIIFTFTDQTEGTIDIKIPTTMENIATNIAKQVNPIHCKDTQTLTQIIQNILFTIYQDEDILNLIDNTTPETNETNDNTETTETNNDDNQEDNTTTETTETTETNNDNPGETTNP